MNKDLRLQEKRRLEKIRNKVYNKISETYIYSKDKFVQQLIEQTYKETKRELRDSSKSPKTTEGGKDNE